MHSMPRKQLMVSVKDTLKTKEDGSLSLGGICLVAGLGGNGRRPGTYDYYMSEPIVEDDAKGCWTIPSCIYRTFKIRE